MGTCFWEQTLEEIAYNLHMVAGRLPLHCSGELLCELMKLGGSARLFGLNGGDFSGVRDVLVHHEMKTDLIGGINKILR